MLAMALFLRFEVVAAVVLRQPQDHRSRCSRWVCFCDFSIASAQNRTTQFDKLLHLPRLFGFVWYFSYETLPTDDLERDPPVGWVGASQPRGNSSDVWGAR